MNNEMLRALVDLRDRQIQKARIQFSNRVSAIELGKDNGFGQQYELAEKWTKRFTDLEKELDKDIAKQVKHYPIYDHVSALKGIGPMLSAKLIALIDIERSPTVSSLWRYAGYAVIDGARERPVKGEKLHYNIRLKTTCYLISSSFLKCGSPYRVVYDSARAYYDVNRPDWTLGHQHNAAMRKMTKMFLSHLWTTWRMIEGLAVSAPYVHERLGHVHLYEPIEFGWPGVGLARINEETGANMRAPAVEETK